MYCKRCGKEIKDDARFCKYCGFNQENEVGERVGIEGKNYSAGLGYSIAFFDDHLVYGKRDFKEYSYSTLDKLKVKKGTGWGRNKGTFEFYVAGYLCTIWFDENEYDELDTVYNYANERKNKILRRIYEENSKERRFKCNVCGKIFCYTYNDVKENDRHQLIAGLASVGTLASAIGGSRYDMYEQNKIASNMSNQVVDYSRCPNCGSKDLKNITDENISNDNNKTSNANMDNIEAIKKYKELLDMGAINQEEFDKKKNELLNK